MGDASGQHFFLGSNNSPSTQQMQSIPEGLSTGEAKYETVSGGGTTSSYYNPTVKQEPTDSTTTFTSTPQYQHQLQQQQQQQPMTKIKDEIPFEFIKQEQFKEEPKYKIKTEEKDNNSEISVFIRGRGNQLQSILIKQKSLLDELIEESNARCGFGRNSCDTYLIHAGKQLSRGTGMTVEQSGIRDKSTIELCARTYGG